jgi:hypothetical protein
MAARKNFSLGITINLENYENLRLDVSGEVESQDDAEEFIVFLDQTLARLGRGSPGTAARVDSYRRRVFNLPAEPAEPSAPLPPPEIAPVTSEAPVAPPAGVAETQPAPPAAKKPKAKEKESRPAEAAPAPVVQPVPTESEFVCEECRVPVTKGQHQMSQLFTGKTLCKKCMHPP